MHRWDIENRSPFRRSPIPGWPSCRGTDSSNRSPERPLTGNFHHGPVRPFMAGLGRLFEGPLSTYSVEKLDFCSRSEKSSPYTVRWPRRRGGPQAFADIGP